MKRKFWIKLQAVVLCLVMLTSIFFATMVAVSADDVTVDADKFEDNFYAPPSNVLGYEIDPEKDYEIVNSALFNKAGQEVWDLTKIGKMSVLAGQEKSGHTTVKLASDGTSKGGEVYFWNEKAPALPEERLEGRTSFGRLFPGYDAKEYTGIRIYLSKEQTSKTATLQILAGSMSKGYWPSSGFYTYELSLPKKAYEGYVYLPFEDFKNNSGSKLNVSTLNFVGFKYKLSEQMVYETYIGELGLWREGAGGETTAGELNIGLGTTLDNNVEYMYYDSYIFNNATKEQWDASKVSGFDITPQCKDEGYYPEGIESSLKLSTTAATKYPEAFFWKQKSDGSSEAHGLLFSKDINISDYDGIRLWVKADNTNPYALVTIMTGSKAYYQSDEVGGYYSYNLIIDGGFEGYVNIPFKNFVNLNGDSLEVKDLNFIAFKHGEAAFVQSEIYFADLKVYGLKANETYKDPPVGAQIDKNKDYEIVNSTLFNEAGQEVWDLTKQGKISVTALQNKNNHRTVKLTTQEGAKGGEIYFWNEKAPALPEEKLEGRTPFGKLFPGYDASEYEGIRIYLNKAETTQSVKIQVLFGKMSKGYWPSSSTGFFIYELQLPKKAFEGYAYLPFSEFVNAAGAKLNSANPNFIAFKYSVSYAETMDICVGELGLYRVGKDFVTDTGELNIGVGTGLKTNTEYLLYESLIFNNSTVKDWELAKLSGFQVTPNYTANGYYPKDAKNSIKLSSIGKSKYPEAFFWNDKYKDGSRPIGILFGTNINIDDFDGIRLWVKTDKSNPYALFTVMIGSKAYYQSDAQGGYYSYNIVIDGGFEGYVNIPFENFVNLNGDSVEVKNFNFIAFKHGEGAYVESDIYVADLNLYGLKANNTWTHKNIGVQLDENKKYELLESKIFADASQVMWEQTKVSGIKATAGITDSKYIPKEGKTSVNIHTTGERSSPEIYYWNEFSDGDRRTHGRFWGDTDCTKYDGVRFWIKIDENNTYSKLTVSLGQMFTGYWPKADVGFFSYDIVIPRGGFEGYVNIPFSYFVNNKGEVLNAEKLNFMVLKYNETGFKETDMWISDLIMYREARKEDKPADDSIIVDGSELQVEHIRPDGTIDDTIGKTYIIKDTATQENEADENKTPVETEFNLLWIIILAAAVLVLAVVGVLIVLIIKKRKNKI